MRVIKTMRPGGRGTGRFAGRYGDRLVAVRYRNSDCGRRVFTTVELIVDERAAVETHVSNSAVNALRSKEPVAIRIS